MNNQIEEIIENEATFNLVIICIFDEFYIFLSQAIDILNLLKCFPGNV